MSTEDVTQENLTENDSKDESRVYTLDDLPKRDPYEVAGYGVKTPGYDSPYLDGHDFDPSLAFAMSGNSVSQEKLQNDLKELADADYPSSGGPRPANPDASALINPQGKLDTSENGTVQTSEGPVEATAFNALGDQSEVPRYGEGVKDYEDTKLTNNLTAAQNPSNYEEKPVVNTDALDGSGEPNEQLGDTSQPTQVETFNPPAAEQ